MNKAQGSFLFVVGLGCGLLISFLGNNFLDTSPSLRYSPTPLAGFRGTDSDIPGSSNQSSPHLPIDMNQDHHHHKDNTSVADDLYNKVRVLCWIMTSPENLRTRAVHVKATWAKRCNLAIYASDKEDKDFPTIAIEVQHGREHLTAKTFQTFDHIFQHYVDEYDWFMKADDDTYVIVENMRYMLSPWDPNLPYYFGHHFTPIVKQGYMSGGGGYVISRQTLRLLGTRSPDLCAKDNGSEDVEFGRCMEKLKILPGDSRDALGRSRFHCFNPAHHLHGGYPKWYYSYDKYGATKGMANMSDYAITFHYVDVQQMYDLEYYIYHLRPYGVISDTQNLNPTQRTLLQE